MTTLFATSNDFEKEWDDAQNWTEVKLGGAYLFDYDNMSTQLRAWCKENCSSEYSLYTASNVFYFNDPAEAMLFKLRWE